MHSSACASKKKNYISQTFLNRSSVANQGKIIVLASIINNMSTTRLLLNLLMTEYRLQGVQQRCVRWTLLTQDTQFHELCRGSVAWNSPSFPTARLRRQSATFFSYHTVNLFTIIKQYHCPAALPPTNHLLSQRTHGSGETSSLSSQQGKIRPLPTAPQKADDQSEYTKEENPSIHRFLVQKNSVHSTQPWSIYLTGKSFPYATI